jgi:Domain of unknown function (DUF5624)
MTYEALPEFSDLYSIFTSDADSIAAHLNGVRARHSAGDPLLVTTGSDIIVFPGSGRAPVTESFRRTTRGFVELTAISHLGVAVPYIIRARELGDSAWEGDAHRLTDEIQKVRTVNSESFWRETVAVAAWAGMESKLADLVDYSCNVTLDFFSRALHDQTRMSFDYLRRHFLDPVDSPDVPIPMNDMMAGTFGLVLLDSSHRMIGWLRNQSLDWERLMIIISGQAGRTTAGLTWQTNSMCHLLWQASEHRLLPERLYIAPHAPSLNLENLRDNAGREALEAQFRAIWTNIRVSVELGRSMFEGYPAFRPAIDNAPVIDEKTESLGQLPAVQSPQDRRAIMTRLRFVMEDPAQQLANATAHYVIDQLCACGNRPAEVVVPGFTNMVYPRRATGPEVR